MQAIKDWHLFLGTSIIIGVLVVIIAIGYAVPILRSSPSLIEDIERPFGRTVSGFGF